MKVENKVNVRMSMLGRSSIDNIMSLINSNPNKYIYLEKKNLLNVLEDCGLLIGAFVEDQLVAFSTVQLGSVNSFVPDKLRAVNGITSTNYCLINDQLVDKSVRGQGLQVLMLNYISSVVSEFGVKHMLHLAQWGNEYSTRNFHKSGMKVVCELIVDGALLTVMHKKL